MKDRTQLATGATRDGSRLAPGGYLRESRRPPERRPRSPAETYGRSQEVTRTKAPERDFQLNYPRPGGPRCDDTALLLLAEVTDVKAPYKCQKS